MNIDILGVPIYYGSDKKGVDLAPNKIREDNLKAVITKYNHKVRDMGNVSVPVIPEKDKFNDNSKMKFLKPIMEVNKDVADEVYHSLASGDFPFILGGDHSIGLGSISGASKFDKDLAVIWIDAHTDINTDKTTLSGNVHGMPLAAAMGIGSNELTDIYYKGQKVKPENVFIIGARDIDDGESKLISEKHLNVYSTETLKKIGVKNIMDEIHKKLLSRNVHSVHLSLDIDCLDKSIVPGTGTPVPNGMSIPDTKFIISYLVKTGLVKSMDLVEFNVLLDKNAETENVVMDFIDWTFKNLKRNSNDVEH